MYTVLLEGIGDFIGAILRYPLGGWIRNSFVNFPVSALIVNIIGSFFWGLIIYFSEFQVFFSKKTKMFLTIGVLGGYITSSTFGYESCRLLTDSRPTLIAMLVSREELIRNSRKQV